ncbi:nucleoside hydrolase [Candidatus Phaeomarinobacter ectocarpi]|uniref:nucleoside hydrolase n=1 Tax=Candidatus Phaeomarinibacter ectocarpi TaxID=1458461 RepID=UPI0005C68238|nr:nucleoside hydrolase [Candidatus Phaeomarinobacter ectocarpi]
MSRGFTFRVIGTGFGLSALLGVLVAGLAFTSASAAPQRVWIDTDAACGAPGRVDPDDCFALAALARNEDIEIVGISTVFGNAGIESTDTITRALAFEIARETGRLLQVHRGAASPFSPPVLRETDATQALARALEEGPLTLVALGPLTNLADLFSARPDLADNVTNAVAVMGKREGHAFHPAEGATGGVLFGHGPLFRDFNLCEDTEAARLLATLDIAVTLLPYELARQVEITSQDLAVLTASTGAVSWVAERSKAWLAFWQEDVGRDGFYPFDLLAAEYLSTPDRFDCALEPARIATDRKSYGALLPQTGLLVGEAQAAATHKVTYCTRYLGGTLSLLEGLAVTPDHSPL